jgi:hypothetical protein
MLLLVSSLAVVQAGCEETATEPEEEEITYGALVVSYEADAGSAESGEVTPEEGGVVSATGPDGITYSLDVCPGAVESSTIVTITPLRELSICSMDSVYVDTSDCIVGALFEPEGLEFDSTAVLTIVFPESGLDCTLDEYYCIVSIDSSSSYYEMIPTVIDYGVPSLTCTLTHFSGYGTHDPDYDFLKKLIEGYSEYGEDFPGDDILGKLMSLADRASAMGWHDLRDLAWQGAYPILDHLAGEAISAADADPGESTLAVLLHYLDPAQAMGFTDIRDRLLQAINDLVVAVATQGQQLCQSGEKEAGQALLGKALDWAAAGLVLDPVTKDMIEDWLRDCAGYTVVLTADKPFVHSCAIRPDQLDGTLLTFTVTVTDAFGDPVDGQTVTIQGGVSGSWVGTTDSGGNYSVTVTGRELGYGPSACPPHSWNVTFYAETGSGTDTYRSNDLGFTIKDIVLTSEFTYSYNFSFAEGENSETMICTVSGSGTGCLGLCSGTLGRYYQRVVNDAYTVTAVGNLEIQACNFKGYYETYAVPETDLYVTVLDEVQQGVCYVFSDIILESCNPDEGCTTSGETDLYLHDAALPFNCDPYSGGSIYIQNDGVGGFSYHWDFNDGGSNWSQTAILDITIRASF